MIQRVIFFDQKLKEMNNEVDIVLRFKDKVEEDLFSLRSCVNKLEFQVEIL